MKDLSVSVRGVERFLDKDCNGNFINKDVAFGFKVRC